MDSSNLATLLRCLHRLAGAHEAVERSDGQLLECYVQHRDEAAFAALVRRHGGMVWGVCGRLLADANDADDVFQATFLVLLHKAASLRGRESLAGFLQGVAWRLARKLRAEAVHRRAKERRGEAARTGEAVEEAMRRDLRRVLDEELDRLPAKYRAPLVLCYLEGLTYAEAARQLGWPDGTVCGRVARARELLRRRLVRRGLTVPEAVLVAAVTETVTAPAASVAAVLRTAGPFAVGQSAVGTVSAPVAALAHRVLDTMAVAKLKTVAALVVALCVCAAGAGWAAHQVLVQKPVEEQREEEAKPAANQANEPWAVAIKQARKDYYGDPLPPGVLARMGSVQLRHEKAHIAFSADGKTLISAGRDASVRFWDMATGRQTRLTRIPLAEDLLRHPDPGNAGISPGGRVSAVLEGDSLDLFDTATGERLRRLPAGGIGHKSLSFSADGRLLATRVGIADNYAIRLWDLSTGKERFHLEKLSQVPVVLLSPDGNRLMYHTADEVLHICDTATGRELGKARVEGWCFALSPDGQMLAAAKNFENKTSVTLWETAGLKKRATFRPSRVTKRIIETPCLTFSPDGKLLAMGGLEALVVWDVSTGKERLRLDDRRAKEVLFSPDGKTLACAGQFEIRLWDIGTGEPLHARAGHDNWVESVAVSPDGRIVASVPLNDPVVRLWETATGKPLSLSPRPDSWVRSCAFAPDGRLLIAGGFGVVRLLDAGNGTEQRRFLVSDRRTGKHNQEILVSHLSADGKRLAVISQEGGQPQTQLTLWDARTGELLAQRPFRGSLGSCFTPDGEAVTVDGREQLTIEDTRAGRQVAAIPGDLGSPTAFSSDGHVLAVGMRKTQDEPNDHSWKPLGVRVIEMASREELFHVEGWIDYTAFSPDDRRLVTHDVTANDLRLWDVETGEPLLRRPLPSRTSIRSLAFLPNGRAVVTGMTDGTLLVWDMTPPTRPKIAVGRALTSKELETLWADLAGTAVKAQRALHTLAASGAPALSSLAKYLHPVTEADPKRVARLLADLDSEQFAVRDAATKELTAMGERIEPALGRVLEGKPSLEVRKRVQAIQEALRGVPPAATLRTLRAIRALERSGTPEARQVLRKLAEGATGARETREAEAALQRLARRTGENR